MIFTNQLGFFQRVLVNGIAFIALAGLMPNQFYVSGILVAFVAAIVLGLLNALVKPILILLSLPITVLSMGLFYFVINALMLQMTSAFMGSSFHFASFGVTFLVALILSAVNVIISTYLQRH
ncbi:phage holin family protein [Ligilactobacillus saerimneri]|uniref:phage holin family protein n=1 Tax=Ligilactobacillus saerimneri TaxID=228229 RepID=UPI001C0F9910|nr:phage holin family protein [Ligilactobacillus saerimneri]MBU5310148.1 phage holin family protein [Ligilactobacillus saerimneri]